MSAIDSYASKGLTGECLHCGEVAPAEMTSVVLFPGSWAHGDCYKEDVEGLHEKAAQVCSCSASKTLHWLGGTLIQKIDGIPFNEIWFKMEVMGEDGAMTKKLTKTRNHRGLLVEKTERPEKAPPPPPSDAGQRES